jgi:hypothetical protein
VVYDDLVRQGKLRYVALSNHPAWQVTQALWIADDRHLAAAPVCAQVKYNLIDRAAEDELAPACQQFGLSIVPFGPLHGGLLAGMQVEEREFSGDKRFGGSGFTDTELEIGRAVQRLSQDWGLQPYQVCRSPGYYPARRSPRRSSAPKLKWRSPPTPPRPTSLWTRPSSTPSRHCQPAWTAERDSTMPKTA